MWFTLEKEEKKKKEMYELKQLKNSEVYSLYHRKVANDYQIKNVFLHIFLAVLFCLIFLWYFGTYKWWNNCEGHLEFPAWEG